MFLGGPKFVNMIRFRLHGGISPRVLSLGLIVLNSCKAVISCIRFDCLALCENGAICVLCILYVQMYVLTC